MRTLTPDEADLWAKVTASIRPLSRTPIAQEKAAASPPETKAAAAPAKPIATAPPPRRVPPPPPPRRVIQNTLDGGWDRRLKGGTVEPDRILDLHGHNLDQAWEAIDRSLETAIQRGERVLLLL